MDVTHNGVEMRQIGQWQELAKYYAGSDGNAWSWSSCTGQWSNKGPVQEFRDTFSARFRGEITS